MRRSGNKEETKRIIMDLEVVLKSHDCPFIVQCLGCFITDVSLVYIISMSLPLSNDQCDVMHFRAVFFLSSE